MLKLEVESDIIEDEWRQEKVLEPNEDVTGGDLILGM